VAYTDFLPDPDIYDPDDDETWGIGEFIDEDGTPTYGYDPVEASRIADLRKANEWQAESGAQMAPPPVPEPEPEPVVPQAPITPDVVQRQTEAMSTPGAEPQQGINIPEASRIAYVHNNPGNLMFAGQAGATRGEDKKGGGSWAKFETPEAGYSALERQIELDAQRGHTLGSFIGKYAPEFENDVARYTSNVAGFTGVSADTPLSEVPRDKLAQAMARQESGATVGSREETATADPGSLLSRVAQGQPRATGPVIPQIPGMLPAQVTTQGVPLTPEQVRQRQQQTMDSTNVQAAFVQNAAQSRVAGRNEAMAEVDAQAQRFEQDAAYRIQHETAVRNAANKKIQETFAEPVGKVDPIRLIKNMSTGDIVMGSIALILGGISQGLLVTGGAKGARNPAIDMLNQALDADVDAQKDALNRGERSKENRVAHWTRVLNNADSGVDAARAEQRIVTAKRVDNLARTQIDNADIQAQALAASAEIMAEGQQLAQGLVDRENQRLSIVYQPPKPVEAPVVGTELAPVGTEDRDPATRAALAAKFDTRNPAHVQQLKQMGTGMSLVGQLERDLATLEQAYGVQPDSAGNYPKDADYVSSATGYDPFDAFDEIGDDDAAAKARSLRQAWTAVELNSRMGWKSEPNSAPKQDEYAGIDQPTLDADVPKKLAELRREIEARRTEVQSSTQAPVRAAWKLQNQFPIAGGVNVRPVTGPTNRGR